MNSGTYLNSPYWQVQSLLVHMLCWAELYIEFCLERGDLLGRRGRNSPAKADRLQWSLSCCPGSALAAYASSAHPARNLWCCVGLVPQQQLLFPPTVGLAMLAGMTPEIRVGRMHVICFPGWQSMWELSVNSRDGSGGGIPQEEAVLRSGGGIQVIY